MKSVMILSSIPDERLEMVLEKARETGYRSIFCKREQDQNVRSAADAEYVADWNDHDALIRIAREEKIVGVIALCDAGVLPASYTAQVLDLPGNPPESMKCLLSKYEFRVLQDKAGVFAPRHFLSSREEEALAQCKKLRFPIIVKPLLASSSFGQTVLTSPEGAAEAFRIASEYSRNGQVCVEEFIEQDSLRGIETDVFVVDDDIIWDGIRWSWRAEKAPLRPACDVYPAELDEGRIQELQGTVRRLLQTAGVRLGQFNIEGFFTAEGRFFVLEINPRQAGYYNPQHIEMYCGVDLTRLLLTTAAGDMDYYLSLKSFKRSRRYLMAYSVFSNEEGILDHVHIDPVLQPHLIDHRYMFGIRKGDRVQSIRDAVRPVSVAVFEFRNASELEEARRKMDRMVYVKLMNNAV